MPAPCLPRREFLSRAGLASGGLVAAGGSAAVGGFFTGADDRLRLGLVGCGGRGTGAAMQAAAADSGLRITALADLFADQIDSALAMLHRSGTAVDCPPARRFSGPAAWRRLLDADVDLVILATSPDARPAQAAATVASGRHVFCEVPAAVDAAGVGTMLAACRAAAAAGLSIGGGLAWRHDPATMAAIAALRRGGIGQPLFAVAHSRIGPAWRKPRHPGQAADEAATRNWIADGSRSGGDLVEHQVHAIDKMLWALGDETPVVAEPVVTPQEPGLAAVRYRFADGRVIEAAVGRRPGGPDQVDELVRGTCGTCDLRAAATGAGRHRRGMEAFVQSVRQSRPLAEGWILCRSTLAAILGREALAAGTALPWADPAPAAAAGGRWAVAPA